jgi:FAD/FMN-containing dehydrogenase
MPVDLIHSLSALVGSDAVLIGEAAMPYYTDWRGRYSGHALAVVFPADTQQVAAIVQLCAANQIAIVPQGGNTSLCGGSVPLPQGRQIVLNLSRMKRIIAIDPTNYTVTVEAGCTLASVRETAEKNDRLFPLGLTAVASHCEIGGNLSTNAGGISVLRYGNMRDLVLGLEAGRARVEWFAQLAQGQYRLRFETFIHRRGRHAGHYHRCRAEIISASALYRHGLRGDYQPGCSGTAARAYPRQLRTCAERI